MAVLVTPANTADGAGRRSVRQSGGGARAPGKEPGGVVPQGRGYGGPGETVTGPQGEPVA